MSNPCTLSVVVLMAVAGDAWELVTNAAEQLMRCGNGPSGGLLRCAWGAFLPAAGITGSRAAASRTSCGRRFAAGLRPVLDPAARSPGVEAAREREQRGS